jgi:fermentation-respiration switch protein FrsA (DUF1100 family)
MIWSIVRIVILAYVGLCIVLYLLQGRMVFQPTRQLDATPADLGMDYEDLWLTASDGVKLHAWFIPAANERGILLLCHGNGGNISHRVESAAIYRRIGLSVLMFDYRGYGKSEGSPNEKGTYRDAQAAWEYLTGERRIAADRVIVLGRSLGGAVASHLAGRQAPAGLIVESAFSSVPDMGARLYPYLPVRRLSRYKYDTAAHVRNVRCPILVMHSRQDEIVPFEMGRKVFEAANEPKTFVEITGGHNDGYFVSVEAYTDTVRQFVSNCFEKGGRIESEELIR